MKILLLNVSYEPIKLISLEEAICKIYSKSVFLEGEDRFNIYGGLNHDGERSTIVMSRVIRNKTYDKSTQNGIPFDRKILFLRDSYTCAYCKKTTRQSALTRDHIIPKAALKHSSIRNMVHESKRHLVNPRYIHGWGNSVTSCRKCNNKKGHDVPSLSYITTRKSPSIADVIHLRLSDEQRNLFSTFITPFLRAVQ